MSFLYRNFRYVLVSLGVVGAIVAPWFVPLAAIVLLALLYPAWEVLFIGLLVDFLWLPFGGAIQPLPLFTLAALLLVWGLEPLRREFLVK